MMGFESVPVEDDMSRVKHSNHYTNSGENKTMSADFWIQCLRN
jgi:hypothetical protein